MSLDPQVAALVEASNNLTQAVGDKISEVNADVAENKKEIDDFVANSKNDFVNQFSIGISGGEVKIWKLGQVDFINSGGYSSSERAYIELILLNGHDYGDQGTRTTHFSAGFRQNFSASHYFAGNYDPDPGRYSYFVMAHDTGDTEGYYYLYLVQCQYSLCTVVTLYENSPVNPHFSERKVIKTYTGRSLGSLDWDVDIIQCIEQQEDVECVYTTRDPANAILTVGKIRYVEMEQITLPPSS